ncbi:hypothetical protein HDV62DRAFT_371617 [Trichoderma sp. SZMC 28011]
MVALEAAFGPGPVAAAFLSHVLSRCIFYNSRYKVPYQLDGVSPIFYFLCKGIDIDSSAFQTPLGQPLECLMPRSGNMPLV